MHKYITGTVHNPIVRTQLPSSAEIGITVPRIRKRIWSIIATKLQWNIHNNYSEGNTIASAVITLWELLTKSQTMTFLTTWSIKGESALRTGWHKLCWSAITAWKVWAGDYFSRIFFSWKCMFDPETQEQLTLQSMPEANLTCCMNRKTLRGSWR